MRRSIATVSLSGMQLYTTPFDDRVFFEIIERRGGYNQYGAPNAPVRLAALAHWRQDKE